MPPGVSVGVQPTTVLLPRVGRYSVLTKSQRSKIQKTVKRKCGGIVIPFLTSARPQLPVTTGDDRPLVRGRDSLVSRRDCCLSPDFFSLSHPILRRTPRNRRVRPTVRGLSPERGRSMTRGTRGINGGDRGHNHTTQQSTRGGLLLEQTVRDGWCKQGD